MNEQAIRTAEEIIKYEIMSCRTEGQLSNAITKVQNFKTLYLEETGLSVMNWIYGGLLDLVKTKMKELEDQMRAHTLLCEAMDSDTLIVHSLD